MNDRIVVSGMGAISPLGSSLEQLGRSLYEGRQVFAPLTMIDTTGYASHLGAEMPPFTCEPSIPAMQSRKMDRVSQMAALAAFNALDDSQGLADRIRGNERVGIVMGAGLGSTSSTDDFYVGMVTRGPQSANPMLFPNTVPNAAASYISILLGFLGLNTTFSHKETSAEQAFCYAVRKLQQGSLDVVFVGGADEISPFLFHAFSVTHALSPRDRNLPEQMCPYDRKRNGLIIGEGAAVLILEREDHLIKRGGRARAEVVAAEVASCPAGIVGYSPCGEDLQLAMSKAFRRSRISAGDIDMISGCAHSTTLLDMAESVAIASICGKEGTTPPVTALKSYTGCFHSCGALRMVLALLAMEAGFIPRTIGLTEPLDGIDPPVDYVFGEHRSFRGRIMLHLSSSYGGTGSAIILSRRN